MKLLGRGTALWNLNQKFIGDMLKILSFLFEDVQYVENFKQYLNSEHINIQIHFYDQNRQ